MGSVFREVVVDCVDPERVADFWAQVLGWSRQESDGYVLMSESD